MFRWSIPLIRQKLILKFHLKKIDVLTLRIYFKNVLSEESVKLCYLVVFNIIVIYIFSKNFIAIHQVSQKIQIFTS